MSMFLPIATVLRSRRTSSTHIAAAYSSATTCFRPVLSIGFSFESLSSVILQLSGSPAEEEDGAVSLRDLTPRRPQIDDDVEEHLRFDEESDSLHVSIA